MIRKPLYILALFVSLLTHSYTTYSQQNEPSILLRPYVATIRLTDQKPVPRGILFDLTDSTILLAPIRNLKLVIRTLMNQHGGTLPPTDSLVSVLALKAYRHADIRRITIRRKGQEGKGFLIGAGLGIVLVLASGGGESGGYTTPAQNALAGAFLFSFPGLLVGTLINRHTNAKKQSIAEECKSRFQKYTVVAQLKPVAKIISIPKR